MLKDTLHALRSAHRPVLIFGAGVRLASAVEEARELARLLGIPVALTWAARDIFPAVRSVDLADVYGGEASSLEWMEPPGYLCVGGFGTHGTRAANFAVQNADWVLSVGSRLDSKATGTPRQYFARGADIFMVDIDPAEVRKFGGVLGRSFTGVQADAKMFLTDMIAVVQGDQSLKQYRSDFESWRQQCLEWEHRYPVCPREYELEESINPYVFMRHLAAHCQPGEIIVSDTGLSLAWAMQGFEFRKNQRFIHAFNQTPMGYGLPAAIGAAYARPGERVVLINGDGGFMLNLQELALLVPQQLPIKIVLINNGGHAMCRQTQEQWLEGHYYSTSVEGGLCFPDFQAVAEAFGLRWIEIARSRCTDEALSEFFEDAAPALLEVRISGDHRLVPQVQYGKPNEDGNPPLPRDELQAQMIVEVVR